MPSIAGQVPLPNRLDTFRWIVEPPGGTFQGRCYTDGSRLDGPVALVARNGWAFVVVGAEDQVIAVARGTPPDWIDDIPGTEAWALLQAVLTVFPDSRLRSLADNTTTSAAGVGWGGVGELSIRAYWL